MLLVAPRADRQAPSRGNQNEKLIERDVIRKTNLGNSPPRVYPDCRSRAAFTSTDRAGEASFLLAGCGTTASPVSKGSSLRDARTSPPAAKTTALSPWAFPPILRGGCPPAGTASPIPGGGYPGNVDRLPHRRGHRPCGDGRFPKSRNRFPQTPGRSPQSPMRLPFSRGRAASRRGRAWRVSRPLREGTAWGSKVPRRTPPVSRRSRAARGRPGTISGPCGDAGHGLRVQIERAAPSLDSAGFSNRPRSPTISPPGSLDVQSLSRVTPIWIRCKPIHPRPFRWKVSRRSLPASMASTRSPAAGCRRTADAGVWRPGLWKDAVRHGVPGERRHPLRRARRVHALRGDPDDLAKNVASLGFDLNDLVARKLAIDYVISSAARSRKPASTTSKGCSSASTTPSDRRRQARRARHARVAVRRLRRPGVLRAELRRLFRLLKDRSVTAVITGERGEGS